MKGSIDSKFRSDFSYVVVDVAKILSVGQVTMIYAANVANGNLVWLTIFPPCPNDYFLRRIHLDYSSSAGI